VLSDLICGVAEVNELDDDDDDAANTGAIPPAQEDFSRFAFYVFDRRVALSEWHSAALGIDLEKSCSYGRNSPLPSMVEEKLVRTLSEELDVYSSWLRRLPFDTRVVEALAWTVQQAQDKAGVRKQVLAHAHLWLASVDIPQEHVGAVHDLIVKGVTDVWSAIRKNCATLMSDIVSQWGLEYVEPLFERLAQICLGASATWQAKEGALLGITTIIRKFRWAHESTSMAGKSADQRRPFQLKFGDGFVSNGLPAFVTRGFRALVYAMLANVQLSVRENATKAFSAYLSRSQFKEALEMFQEIVDRLRCLGAPETGTPAGPPLLDAYEAEGLLGVCVFIIKHIQPGFLLPNWPLYFSTFARYLAHPASTVRQAASTVFKYVVAKDGSNSTMLKLVLQGLAANWPIERTLLASDANKPAPKQQPHPPHSAQGGRARTWSTATQGVAGASPRVAPPPRAGPAPSWQWKEGRLLAYELVLKFLLTNHTHYLFPTALVGKARAASGDHYRIQASSSGNPRRLKVPVTHHEMMTPAKGGSGRRASGSGSVEIVPKSRSLTDPRGAIHTQTKRPTSARVR